MHRVPLPALSGVPLRISWTWMTVALSLYAVSWYLFLPQSAPVRDLVVWIVGMLLLTIGLVLSLIAHEFGHIWAARRSGATLDAFEPSLLGALPDTSFAPQSPSIDVRVASAGPLVSVGLAAACGLAWFLAQRPDEMPGVALLLLGGFNLSLFSLNLLPGYPFDGGRLFRAFMWYLNGDLVGSTRIAAAYGQFLTFSGFLVAIVLLGLGEGYALWGAWLLLFCWTLSQARGNGLTQTVWNEAGRALQIDDLFQAGVNRVPASATIDDSIESLLDNFRRGPTLVVEGGEIVGVVDLHAFRKIPRANWSHLTVGEVMSPLDPLPRLESDDSVARLLAELPSGSTKVILVQRDGKVVAAADREFVVDRVQSYIRAERLSRPRRL